ncbi:MAG: methionine synthase [Actinophytocola sp.]|nr:methionine synthase [Actinophytocola sp.]
MADYPWLPEAATGIGSMPDIDLAEAAAVIFGELPEFPHVPELPGRGVGSDLIGRSAAMLVDLAVELMPSGYRVAAHPGLDHRRGVDLLRWDLDGVEQAAQQAGAKPEVIKTQVAGPWTLSAGIELPRGHRVLTDHGALREFTESLVEGVIAHVAELAARTGAKVVVQLDEPSLPEVLAGSLPTASGYGMVSAVAAPAARELLASMIEPLERATGSPVVVHCCDRRPPIALLRGAGAGAIAVDATLFDGAPGTLLDEIGEAWDAGVVFFLGLVPALEPGEPAELRELASPALRLVDRLGFNRSFLRDRAVPTPTCGFAGASIDWMRRALALSRDVGKAFVEPPESW